MKTYMSILAVFLLLFACAARVQIGDIKQNPRQFHDRQITLYGVVDDVITLPLLGLGIYEIDDGSGKIWVKPAGETPFKGDRVKVTGTIKVGLTISGKTFGLILIEHKEDEN